MFGGSWKSQLKCLDCTETKDLLEAFFDINLDIQTTQCVNQTLGKLVMEEELFGENAYHGKTCRQMTLASETLTVKDAPKDLLLVLNRFSEFTGDKKGQEIDLP